MTTAGSPAIAIGGEVADELGDENERPRRRLGEPESVHHLAGLEPAVVGDDILRPCRRARRRRHRTSPSPASRRTSSTAPARGRAPKITATIASGTTQITSQMPMVAASAGERSPAEPRPATYVAFVRFDRRNPNAAATAMITGKRQRQEENRHERERGDDPVLRQLQGSLGDRAAGPRSRSPGRPP